MTGWHSAALVLYVWLGGWLLPHVLDFLQRHRVVAANYRGVDIPAASGVYIWIMSVVYAVLFSVLAPLDRIPVWPHDITAYVLALTVVFFAGWLDDTVGDRQTKGLRGHWTRWRETGTFGTGLLKAGMVAVSALWMMVEMKEGWLRGTTGFLLVVLTSNAVNLLDLRPGRALKFGYFLIVPILLFGEWARLAAYLLPILVSMFWIFPFDLRARSMLGDAGANCIGFALGLILSISVPLWLELLLIGGGLWLHAVAERDSVSRMIERRAALRRLDEWGRNRDHL